MKLIYATVFLTVLAVFVNGQQEISNEVDQSDFVERVAAYRKRLSMQRVQNRLEDICPGQFENFKEAISEVAVCHNKLNLTHDTVCTILNQDVTQCMTPLYTFFKNCAPEKQKFLIKMMENIFRNGVKFFCTSDFEHLMEFVNPCTKSFTVKHQCVKNLLQKIDDFKINKQEPTKENLCSLIKSYSSCAQSFVDSHCNNPITRESWTNLFNVFNKVCS